MRSRNVIENTKYIMQYTLEIFALFKNYLKKIAKLQSNYWTRVIKILYGSLIYSVSNASRSYAQQSEIYDIAESLNKHISTGATRNDQNNATLMFYINASVINAPTSLLRALTIPEM